MKKALMDYLACSNCKSSLALEEKITREGEVLEGFLLCPRCGKSYPIISGIPRFIDRLTKREDKIANFFGFEWKRFKFLDKDYERQFLDWIDPINKRFFKDKIILDAGCGKGRHVYHSAQFGAKAVIGVDFSDAVEVAYENTKQLPNAHIIQANILNLPLKEIFDYIYCLGVLQFLDCPKKGFLALLKPLKNSGKISIHVYGRENNGLIIFFINPLRRMISSLPHIYQYLLSWFLASILYLTLRMIYRPLNERKWLKPLAKRLFYNQYFSYISNFSFKDIHLIIFDQIMAPFASYLRKGEVVQWFKTAGMDYKIFWHNKNSWRATGVKSSHARF